MATEIRVPTLGESVSEATIARWFKQPGDAVAADEPLLELETDKVTLEVNAPAAGVLSEIVMKNGETVEPGALLGQIDAKAGGKAAASLVAPKALRAESQAPRAEAKPAQAAPAAPARPATPARAGAATEIRVPTLGESVTEATIGRWFKQPGDAVNADEPLVELETEKVTLEVNAPTAGVLSAITAGNGVTVMAGALLGEIDTGAAAPAAGSPDSASQPLAPARAQVALVAAPPAPLMPPAPSAAKMAAENGVDLTALAGSGRRGQVLKGDVLTEIAKAESPHQNSPAPLRAERPDPVPAPARAPAPRAPSPASDAPREERVRMTKLRQTIARRLKDAQNTAAMLTTFNDVDMSAVMALRARYKDVFEKKHGIKLGFMGFFVKACVGALKELPAVNAEIDGQDIIYKNYYHVGIAVGTEKGLVVPVVRDAEDLSLAGIEKAIAGFGKKARDGQLKIEDMQGGTFTITNGGIYGSLMSTPILNAPQSGILGMHKIQDRPIVVAGKVEIRPMMYLALSYDHRIVDGREAVTFLVRVKEALEDPPRLMLEV